MTPEERLDFHEAAINSIDRTLDQIVEVQQRHSERIQSLMDVADRTLSMMGALVQTVQSMAEQQQRADQRIDRVDQRIDRITELLQRFLDSQSGANGRG